MKKIIIFTLTTILLLSAVACTRKSAAKTAGNIELIIFAAASMTETLEEISGLYAEASPNVTLVFNFDSSGTLKTQIQEGADCDLFISAGIRQVDQLDITSSPNVNTEGLDFILEASRINLLENKVALVVPEGNPKSVGSFYDLAEKLKSGSILMAMGNSDVPVGQYTQMIFEYFRLNEVALSISGVLTYGTNVKEVTTQVVEASVDCGIVYSTDAFSAGLEIIDTATLEMCGQVIYPAAVLKTSKNSGAAQAFLDYLTGDEAITVFRKVGFSPAFTER
ncbi:MAG: molybdate ABC transporter substrate-binding protein [Treponema sp.]|nr:molybdate ABC transporter substrate-binding protein [Treponema sp.]